MRAVRVGMPACLGELGEARRRRRSWRRTRATTRLAKLRSRMALAVAAEQPREGSVRQTARQPERCLPVLREIERSMTDRPRRGRRVLDADGLPHTDGISPADGFS